VSFPVFVNGNGTHYGVTFVVYQGYRLKTWTNANGSAHSSYLTNTVESNGTLIANRQLNIVGVAGDASSQLYTYEDSTGRCHGRSVASSKNAVSALANPGCSTVPPPPPPFRF
jgi:hypothetical protein